MRCGRGVNGRPPTAACKGACVYKNAKPSESHILFALVGIFVHVCRRCQRADRAGGFHVGLIFCNFSIKRKVKDYNLFKGLSLATKHDVHFLNSTLKQRGSIFTIISEPSCILSTKKKQMAGTICSGGMYWIRTNDLCRVEAAL